MVYAAGHGVADQQQWFVLNDKGSNIVPIESKLRTIAREMNTNVLAFYDVCRSDKARYPNLKRGDDEPLGAFADTYEYVHVSTHPLTTVDAKSKLA